MDLTNVRELPQVNPQNVTFISNYYDGPLSGLVRVDGDIQWFSLHPDSDLVDRVLAVYPLSEEERDTELRRKSLFEQCVGTHWSRDLKDEDHVPVNADGNRTYKQAIIDEFGVSDDELNEARTEIQTREPIAWLHY